ncbi:MAG: NUDIX domain-containing protein [Flavobacteriaceae bacterium]|nr:NUDIX domain-containing protein [Flavobacteriaceae bacterium]
MIELKEEILDILDENGNYTGQSLSKKIIHQKGYFHPTVHVWIFDQTGQVLLQKRAEAKDTFPGLWDVSVAGHIDAGEPIKKAAQREVEEEIGLLIDEEGLLESGIRKSMHEHPNGIKDYEYQYIFLYQMAIDLSALKIQQEEVAELKLVAFDSFREDSMKNSSRYVPQGPGYYQFICEQIRDFLKEH